MYFFPCIAVIYQINKLIMVYCESVTAEIMIFTLKIFYLFGYNYYPDFNIFIMIGY